MSEAPGADELTCLLTGLAHSQGRMLTKAGTSYKTRGTSSRVVLGSGLSRTGFTEAGEAPVGSQLGAVGAGLWSHQLRAGSRSGGQGAALATRAGEAPAELGWGPEPGETRATQNPDSQQDCPGGPCPDPPPTSTDACETHRPGGELLAPPRSLSPPLTQEAEPRLPSILGLGRLRSPPPPQQLTRPAQAPLLPCLLLPCLVLGDVEGLCPQLARLPARPPLGSGPGVHEYLTWEAA